MTVLALACFLTGAAMAEDPGREPDAPERQLSRTELLLHRANSLESELERLHHLLEQQLDVVGRGIVATQKLQAKLATEDYAEEEATAELDAVQKELNKQYAAANTQPRVRSIISCHALTSLCHAPVVISQVAK